MKLINADECPCILCEDIRNAHCTYEHRSCSKFCAWLNNTAYDVEKVVEEIIEASQGVCHYCGCDLNSGDTIDIVKRGGIYE